MSMNEIGVEALMQTCRIDLNVEIVTSASDIKRLR